MARPALNLEMNEYCHQIFVKDIDIKDIANIYSGKQIFVKDTTKIRERYSICSLKIKQKLLKETAYARKDTANVYQKYSKCL